MRQSLVQGQFEKCLTVFVQEVEREKCDGRVAEQSLRYLAPAETGLNGSERQDAIAERHNLAVEDDAAIELQRGGGDLRKSMRHVVERSRIDADRVSLAMDLGADAVVLVIRERA